MRALGLQGAGSQETELLDGVVHQTLDVAPLVRRGRTLANSGGIFQVAFDLVRATAGAASVSWTPFAAGANAFPPFPQTIPTDMELWLLYATLRRASGTGTVEAMLRLTNIFQGWGQDTGASQAAIQTNMVLGHWDTVVTIDGVNFVELAQGGQMLRLGMRVPRQRNALGNLPNITATIDTSATATYEMQIIVGLFPLALGQDGIV
jgi:hypothetical protein